MEAPFSHLYRVGAALCVDLARLVAGSLRSWAPLAAEHLCLPKIHYSGHKMVSFRELQGCVAAADR